MDSDFLFFISIFKRRFVQGEPGGTRIFSVNNERRFFGEFRVVVVRSTVLFRGVRHFDFVDDRRDNSQVVHVRFGLYEIIDDSTQQNVQRHNYGHHVFLQHEFIR